jgi:hypothetical protein
MPICTGWRRILTFKRESALSAVAGNPRRNGLTGEVEPNLEGSIAVVNAARAIALSGTIEKPRLKSATASLNFSLPE